MKLAQEEAFKHRKTPVSHLVARCYDIEQLFPNSFLEPPQHCTFWMSPLSITPDSTHKLISSNSKQCCQSTYFVARFSDYPAPFETLFFFKSLGKNIATSWTNLKFSCLLIYIHLYTQTNKGLNVYLLGKTACAWSSTLKRTYL